MYLLVGHLTVFLELSASCVYFLGIQCITFALIGCCDHCFGFQMTRLVMGQNGQLYTLWIALYNYAELNITFSMLNW